MQTKVIPKLNVDLTFACCLGSLFIKGPSTYYV